jgi:REP element-mobilizing transposase RayT
MVSQLHERKTLRLEGYNYSSAGAYFVTLTIHNRLPILGTLDQGEMRLSKAGQIVKRIWLDLPIHYRMLNIDVFCVMPDHFHGILLIQNEKSSLSLFEIIRGFKTFSARRINLLKNTPGASVWQRGYYEHIIRNEEDLDKIRLYIQGNPSNWNKDS